MLGNWVLHNQSAEARAENLAVEPGDTIDFIVSIHESLNNNDFIWSPVIRLTGPNAIRDANGPRRSGMPKRISVGPSPEREAPLTVWEKYAQALLLSNEFLFVD